MAQVNITIDDDLKEKAEVMNCTPKVRQL